MRRLTRNTLTIVAVVFMAIVLTASTSQAGTVDVDIVGFAFVPDTLIIAPGTVVRWTNSDAVQHSSTSDAPLWDSGFLNQGQSWSRQFDAVGAFPYHCTPHPGMTAVIIVEAAVPGLSTYGTFLLVLMLMLAAFFVIRRKNSVVPA